ncbi:MAG: ATP-binding cassette domain-containing protein [Clostridiales bacterium]|nr:ATP-binding cassette domain-containing protein [Candidatus Equinaster intestinalis]
MSWFEEQLKYREDSDNADFANAIDSIANAVMGKRLRESLSQNDIAESAIDEILKFYHCKPESNEHLPTEKTVEEQIEYRMRPFGIKSRTVTLEKGWYRHTAGAMLGTLKENGASVALIPGKVSGYSIFDIKNGKKIKLNRKTEKLLDSEAICFYEPLPQKAMTVKELIKFMVKQLSAMDIVLYFALFLLSAVFGLLSPLFTKWLFGNVLKSGSISILVSLAVFAVCFAGAQLCFKIFQGLTNAKIGIKEDIAVSAAVMNRILSLPTSFFREYSAGNLFRRFADLQLIFGTLFTTVGMTVLTAVFSLIYIIEIITLAPSLALPASLFTFLTLVMLLIHTVLQIKITKRKMELAAKTSGVTYSTVAGIQKVKLAGAEKRAFSRWARRYSEEAELEYNPPLFLKLNNAIFIAVTLIGTMVLYIAALKNNVAVADYYAVGTAYGMITAAFTAVIPIMANITNIRPTFKVIKPILETEPEKESGKDNIAELKGAIELSHISFRYEDDMPYVIDDLSLKIQPGEYLAVVGSTGCGKSTLMRLLLGFETPGKGSIYFDGKDMSKIDPESLRRKIGTVMQDSSLFFGDIYSNIVITAPHLTLDEAWEAAETASIAEDIRNMPMGMHTYITDGQGGISGGQKQRLMIARAVAPKPKILMFDEATSALDNITQKNVTEAIDKLNCTRIVIAHRLSTIQHADRIICLDKGKIAEEGTFDELIAKNGLFASLVERQRLDL